MTTTADRKPWICPECGGEAGSVEVRGVYDGGLYWSCLGCGHAWVRQGTGREEIAQLFVHTHLQGRASA